MHNGHNVSCFEGKDGSIELTVAGGSPPYKYQWNNGNFEEDPSELSAGHYSVYVVDRNDVAVAAQIDLTEPDRFEVSLTAYLYPNGKHISCFSCSNGSITSNVQGGTPPFNYNWETGQNTSIISGLSAGDYSVEVSDGNGCIVERASTTLSGPERSDWTMFGNTGSNPNSNFTGTTDSVDFVFRTNNTERLRIKADGEIQSSKMIGPDYDIVMVGPDGNLLRIDPDGRPIRYPRPIEEPQPISCIPWNTCGNSIFSNNYLGTRNNMDLIIKTNAIEQMRITKTGIVGIGIDPNTQTFPPLHNYKLLVGGTIGAKEVWVSLGQPAWPDYVFSDDYKLTTLDDLKIFIKTNRHLPTMPPALEVEKAGAMNVGLIQTNSIKEIEQLYLQLFLLNDRITELEKQNIALQKIVITNK